MSKPEAAAPYGDPLSAGYWEAAQRKELVIQRCADCGAVKVVPRPFCTACQSDKVGWVKASGFGTIYSMTTVRRALTPAIQAPYVNAIVELEEGARMLSNIVGGAPCKIGDRVQVTWQERENAPPLPVFTPVGAS